MPPKVYRAKIKRKRPTNPRLTAHLGAKKNDSLFIGDVTRYLQSRTDDRPSGVIHPSEMAKSDWCPRATWHRIKGHSLKELPAPHSLRSELIFAEGHTIHHKWQQWAKEMGILWGSWECIHCGDMIFEWSDNLPYSSCHDGIPLIHSWAYREVPLENGSLVRGHSDGIINPSTEESLVLEAKSIGPGTIRKLDLIRDDQPDEDAVKVFNRISRPMGDHFRQTQIYLRMVNEDAVITGEVGSVKRAVVLYEYKADQQVREFVVTYRPHWTEDLFETARDIEWAIDHDRSIGCPYGGCSQCESYEEN